MTSILEQSKKRDAGASLFRLHQLEAAIAADTGQNDDPDQASASVIAEIAEAGVAVIIMISVQAQNQQNE